MELQTKFQERTQKRRQHIADRFETLRGRYAEASQSAIAFKIAEEQQMTFEGVRKILIAYGKWQQRVESAQG